MYTTVEYRMRRMAIYAATDDGKENSVRAFRTGQNVAIACDDGKDSVNIVITESEAQAIAKAIAELVG